jgi:hypothetical protein
MGPPLPGTATGIVDRGWRSLSHRSLKGAAPGRAQRGLADVPAGLAASAASGSSFLQSAWLHGELRWETADVEGRAEPVRASTPPGRRTLRRASRGRRGPGAQPRRSCVTTAFSPASARPRRLSVAVVEVPHSASVAQTLRHVAEKIPPVEMHVDPSGQPLPQGGQLGAHHSDHLRDRGRRERLDRLNRSATRVEPTGR